MSFKNLANDPFFVTGLELLNNLDDKKFIRLVDRMIQDFEPNRLSSNSELELASMEKSLKLNNNQCQCLLNCLNLLLKEVNVISDVTKPLVLKNVLSTLFSLNGRKVELWLKGKIAKPKTDALDLIAMAVENLIPILGTMNSPPAMSKQNNIINYGKHSTGKKSLVLIPDRHFRKIVDNKKNIWLSYITTKQNNQISSKNITSNESSSS